MRRTQREHNESAFEGTTTKSATTQHVEVEREAGPAPQRHGGTDEDENRYDEDRVHGGRDRQAGADRRYSYHEGAGTGFKLPPRCT
jgi:hypothetical protein